MTHHHNNIASFSQLRRGGNNFIPPAAISLVDRLRKNGGVMSSTEELDELKGRIQHQELTIQELRASEANYVELLKQERERVASLRDALHQASENSATAFNDLKENVETLRSQLERKRSRIEKLENELEDCRKQLEASGSQGMIDGLRSELRRERAVNSELRSILDTDRGDRQTLNKPIFDSSPILSEKPPRYSPSPASSIEGHRMQREYVTMLLETEKSNVDKLQKELQKHLEVGSSSMYIDGFLDAWRLQLEEKLRQHSIFGTTFLGSKSNSPGIAMMSSSPPQADFRGLLKKFVASDAAEAVRHDPDVSSIMSPNFVDDAELVHLQSRVLELEEGLRSKNEAIKSLEDTASMNTSALQKEIDRLSQELSVRDGTIKSLESLAAGSDSKLALAQTSASSLKQEIDRLSQELSVRDVTIKSLESLAAGFDSNRSKIQTQVDMLSLDIQTKEQEIKRLINRSAELENVALMNSHSHSVVVFERDAALAELATCKTEILKLSGTITAHNGSIMDLESQVSHLVDIKTQNSDKIKQLHEVIELKSKEFEDLTSQIQVLENTKALERKLLLNEIEASKQAHSKISLERDTLKASIEEYSNSRIATLEDEVNELRHKTSEYAVKISALEAELSENVLLLRDRGMSVFEKDNCIDELNVKIVTLRRSEENFSMERASLLSELDDQRIAFASLVLEHKTLLSKCDENEAELYAMKGRLQEEEYQVSSLQTEVSNWIQKSTDYSKKVETLETLAFEKNCQLEDLKFVLESERENSKSVNDGLEVQLETLRKEISTYVKELSMRENKNFDLESRLHTISISNANNEDLKNDLLLEKERLLQTIETLRVEITESEFQRQAALDKLQEETRKFTRKLEDLEFDLSTEKFQNISIEQDKDDAVAHIGQLNKKLTEAEASISSRDLTICSLEDKLHFMESELEVSKSVLNASKAEDFDSIEFLHHERAVFNDVFIAESKEEMELREARRAALAALITTVQDKPSSPIASQSPIEGYFGLTVDELLVKIDEFKSENSKLRIENKKLVELNSALDYNVLCLTNYSHTVCAKNFKLEDTIKSLSATKADLDKDDALVNDLQEQLSSTKKKLDLLSHSMQNSPDSPASRTSYPSPSDFADKTGEFTALLNAHLPLESGQKSMMLQEGHSWGKGLRALNFGMTPAKTPAKGILAESFFDLSIISNMSDVSLENLISPVPVRKEHLIDDDDLNEQLEKVIEENERLKKESKQLADLVSALEYQVSCTQKDCFESTDAKIKLEKQCEKLKNRCKTLEEDLAEALDVIDNMQVQGFSSKETLKIFTQRHSLEKDLMEAREIIHSLYEKHNILEQKINPTSSGFGFATPFQYDLPRLRASPKTTPQSLGDDPNAINSFSDVLSPSTATLQTPFKDQDWRPLNVSLDFAAIGEESMYEPNKRSTSESSKNTPYDSTVGALKEEYQRAVDSLKAQHDDVKMQTLTNSHKVLDLESRISSMEKVVTSSPSSSPGGYLDGGIAVTTPNQYHTPMSQHSGGGANGSLANNPVLYSSGGGIRSNAVLHTSTNKVSTESKSTSSTAKKTISFADTVKEHIIPAFRFFSTPAQKANNAGRESADKSYDDGGFDMRGLNFR